MNIQSIKVKTVDTEKLIDFLGIKLKYNEKLSFDSFSIFEDKFKIDIDCCFSEIENFHFGNRVQPHIKINCLVKTPIPDVSFPSRIDRRYFSKIISVDSYSSLATEVNLVDFIRFNYNPRIMGNQQFLMKYIKASKVEN